MELSPWIARRLAKRTARRLAGWPIGIALGAAMIIGGGAGIAAAPLATRADTATSEAIRAQHRYVLSVSGMT